ncbi:MAG TPA: hypothetical protein VK176_00730 [Phycisphaerales bacterium]|nr:hypothetical protein [Phycisphaerales bacterium]
MQKRKVKWWEPRWSFAPRYRAEIGGTGIFSPWFWVRVMGVTAILLGAMVGFVWWQAPGAFIPWLQLAFAPFAIPCLLYFKVGLLYVLPPYIQVHAKGVHISHGDSGFIILMSKIRQVRISMDDCGRAMLVIAYLDRKDRPKTRTVGISDKVDLVQLGEIFAVAQHIEFAAGAENLTPGEIMRV